MKTVVTGATGFVGAELLKLLDRPHILSRNADKAKQSLSKFNVTTSRWDSMKEPAPSDALEGVDAIFHLAGEPIAGGRWTAEKKKAILESRTIGTRNLVDGIAKTTNRPKVLVSASAVGYYGSRGDETLTENSTPGNDFLAEVCKAWEHEAKRAESLGVRVVTPRIGVVFGKGGGAIAKMMTPFKLGLGGPLGNGQHWMPWVHVHDLASLLVYVAKNESIRGPINAVAPNPVRNKHFTKAFAGALHRPAFLPAPYFMMKLVFGEMAQILFDSQNVQPTVANQAGFPFQYPTIEKAMEEIVAK